MTTSAGGVAVATPPWPRVKEVVVLPYKEFVRIEEESADYHDLQALRAAKQAEGQAPTLTLSEVKAELGISKIL